MVASAIAWLGPPGTDLAAHVYQRDLFLHDGFLLWNNFWYAGRYTFVTYSLIYYPLAAAVGIHLLGVLSAAIAAAFFGLLVEREFGPAGRWAAWTFATVTGISLLGAAFPYQLGLACALAALLAIQRRRLAWFAVLVVLTFTASPLAFALLVVVLGAVALSRSGTDIGRPAVVVGVTAVLGLALWRVFPGGGWFPFSALGLGAVLAFCATGFALTWRVVDARVLRYVFATYGAACVVFYVIPSGIGENIVRLRFLALPLAVLTLSLRNWRPRPLAVGVLALAVMWNLAPIASSFDRGGEDPSANAAYWQPAVVFLRKNLTPSYRVEAVDTSGHWDAVYLPRAGIPIVRGWFRQNDFPQNAVLYGRLSSHAYLRWLRSLGVKYVVLTAAPADYSARREAALLRSHYSGLRPVFRAAHRHDLRGAARRGDHPRPGSRPRALADDRQHAASRLARRRVPACRSLQPVLGQPWCVRLAATRRNDGTGRPPSGNDRPALRAVGPRDAVGAGRRGPPPAGPEAAATRTGPCRRRRRSTRL